jgi:class III poly(R)-hydroxyalkanoic acid synthase PhaE subunit
MQHQAGHDFMSQWAGPSANWQKMVSAMMPVQMPGSNASIYGIGEDFDKINQMLSMPGLGFFRESQEQHQSGARLAQDYFQANQKFNASFMQVSIESLQAFQEKITALYENDDADNPSSLRSIYDLWIDISEAHYAEYAMSEEYQSLYGDMVNKLMALKKHYSNLIDDTLESLNLPSRRELDTVHQRLQQTRRDNQDLRRELKEIRALLVDKKIEKKKSPGKKATAPVKKSVAKKSPVKKPTSDKPVRSKTGS